MKNRRILETLAMCEVPSKFVDCFLGRLRKLSDAELDSECREDFQGKVMVEIGFKDQPGRVVFFKHRSINKVIDHLKKFIATDNNSVSKIIIRKL